MEIAFCHNFISGAWTPGEREEHAIFSPKTGEKIGSITVPTTMQVKQAIESAAQVQKEWAKLPIKERSKVLFQFRNILLRELDSISELKSAESGKTFEEGKAGLLKGIEVLEFALSI